MDLLLIGDSLIAYHDWRPALPAHRVTALGVPGETVQGLRLRLPKILARVPRVDAVVVMVGTNNLAMGDLFFFNDCEELIASLAKGYPAAAIVLTSLPPVQLPGLGGDAVPRLNRLLAEAVSRRRGMFLDLYAEFLDAAGGTDRSLFTGDGVHLSPKGYQRWSARLAKLLAALPR